MYPTCIHVVVDFFPHRASGDLFCPFTHKQLILEHMFICNSYSTQNSLSNHVSHMHLRLSKFLFIRGERLQCLDPLFSKASVGTARDSSDIDSIYIQEHIPKFSYFCNFIPFDIEKISNALGLYSLITLVLIP